MLTYHTYYLTVLLYLLSLLYSLQVVDTDFTAAEGGGHLGFVQAWLLDVGYLLCLLCLQYLHSDYGRTH